MEVTNEQLDFYKKEGYVVIPNGLTADDLEPLIQDHNGIVDEIAHDLFQQGKVTSLYEASPLNAAWPALRMNAPRLTVAPISARPVGTAPMSFCATATSST